MKVLLPLLIVVLCGCESLATRHGETPGIPAECHAQTADGNAEYWLLERQQLCALPELERRARLQLWRETEAEGGISPLERLLLASCRPDQTPGLLYQALAALPADSERAPAEQALIQLIRDSADSYRVLEQQRLQMEEKLRQTIDGIQQIEADLDSMQSTDNEQ